MSPTLLDPENSGNHSSPSLGPWMTFGKHKGTPIATLPWAYLVWLDRLPDLRPPLLTHVRREMGRRLMAIERQPEKNTLSIDSRGIREWVEAWGFWLYEDADLCVGQRFDLSHSRGYGNAHLEILSDGEAVVTRRGGRSGYVLLLEQERVWYPDGSHDTERENPFLALHIDVANNFIEQHLPPWDSQEYASEFQLASTGAKAWWDEKWPLIPDEEKFDERDLASLDHLIHLKEGRRILVSCLDPKEGR